MSIFKEYYLNILTKKYLQFSGRASRSEYWYFILFNIFITILIGTLDLTLLFSDIQLPPFMIEGIEIPINLALIYWALTIIPITALMFRRMHDIGKSGLWLLILLIPILGIFILIYFFAKAGDKETNKYGEDPLAEGNFQPKPMGALTIVAIIVLLIVANIAFIILVLGVSIATLTLNLEGEVNSLMNVEQNVTTTKSTMSINSKTITDNKLTIKVPLTPNYALKYSNIKLCKPADKSNDPFFSKIIADNYPNSFSCSQGICEVSIGIDDKTNYPSDVQMWIENANGNCQKEDMPAKTPTLAGYSTKIKLTPELLSSMDVKDSKYQINSKNTDTHSSFTMNGVKVIQFEYSEKLDMDTILINGEPKVTVIFDHIAKKSVPMPAKIEKSKQVEKVEKVKSTEETTKTPIAKKPKEVKEVVSEKKTTNSSTQIEDIKKEIEELKKKRDALKKQAEGK